MKASTLVEKENHNDVTTLNVYDKSSANISSDLLIESIVSAARMTQLPQAAIEQLINLAMAGKQEASFCLLNQALCGDLPEDVKEQAHCNLDAAAKGKHPYAIYIKGCMALCNSSQKKVDRGIDLLNAAADEGIHEGHWRLALYWAKRESSEAAKYGLLAAKSGYYPAIQALVYAHYILNDTEQKLGKSHKASLAFLHKKNDVLNRQVETLSTSVRAEKTEINQQIKAWKKRCKASESQLSSWSAKALKDENILKLQAAAKKAEEDWLEAKCAQEEADASRIKAEQVADDLARRNKYLTNLLRKSGMPFNECESSSSSDETNNGREGGPE